MIDDLWYKNAVIYCLDVGSFMDTSGDGTGDFQGLARRLDYLAGLASPACGCCRSSPRPTATTATTSATTASTPRTAAWAISSSSRTRRACAGSACPSTSSSTTPRIGAGGSSRRAPTRARARATFTSGRRPSRRAPTTAWGSGLALRYDWRGNAVLAVHNLSAEAREVTLAVRDLPGQPLVNLLSHDNSRGDRRGTHKLAMPPYGYAWYRAGGLDDLRTRQPK